METEYNVLDHGYLKYIEHWGSDERIIESARMSTNKGFLGWGPVDICNNCGEIWNDVATEYNKPSEKDKCYSCHKVGQIVRRSGDEKLLRYLYEHKHATPFEMAGIVIEVQAPIFVFREWRTHRTCSQVADEYFLDDSFPGDSSYNEMSARYIPLPAMNYIPTIERLLINSKTNKQAGTIKDAEELTEESAKEYQIALASMYSNQENLYQKALKHGVPKELARIHLPVGRYSRMRASANLRNWLAFLTLRIDENAQWEIREYANKVGKIISNLYPKTWELFLNSKESK